MCGTNTVCQVCSRGFQMNRPQSQVRMQSWPLHTAMPGLKDAFRRDKCLRFADVEGLPLVSVKVFQENDRVDDLTTGGSVGRRDSDSRWPTLLRGGVDDLVSLFALTEKSTTSTRRLLQPAPRKELLFEQTVDSDLLGLVERQHVCLESVAVNGFTVVGTILVQNLAFDKAVSVRHTSDNWRSYTDLQAVYVPGSSDGRTDRFSFTLVLPESLLLNSRIQFAVNFRSAGGDYWDSNGGSNYSFLCRLTAVKPDDSPRPNAPLSTVGDIIPTKRYQRRSKGQFSYFKN